MARPTGYSGEVVDSDGAPLARVEVRRVGPLIDLTIRRRHTDGLFYDPDETVVVTGQEAEQLLHGIITLLVHP